MLELRPTCEHCDVALPPDAVDAMICSFECTFCRACVDVHQHEAFARKVQATPPEKR